MQEKNIDISFITMSWLAYVPFLLFLCSNKRTVIGCILGNMVRVEKYTSIPIEIRSFAMIHLKLTPSTKMSSAKHKHDLCGSGGILMKDETIRSPIKIKNPAN